MSWECPPEERGREAPDAGDLIVAVLAGTLAALRDHLAVEGFEDAAELVADLADVADDYIVS